MSTQGRRRRRRRAKVLEEEEGSLSGSGEQRKERWGRHWLRKGGRVLWVSMLRNGVFFIIVTSYFLFLAHF